MEENTIYNKKHTLQDIKKSCEIRFGDNGELLELCLVAEELKNGIDRLQKYERVATIYGSARFPQDNIYSAKARELGFRLAKELGFAVITGGGHGIMEAGNQGAYDARGVSIGATIVLPHEQTTNTAVTEEIPFEYFFTRKTALRYGSEIAIYFPGGYGTFDEFFELITLVQNNKMEKIPIILFGVDFWSGMDKFVKEVLIDKFQTINAKDRDLYIITDDIDEVIKIAASAPVKKSGLGDQE